MTWTPERLKELEDLLRDENLPGILGHVGEVFEQAARDFLYLMRDPERNIEQVKCDLYEAKEANRHMRIAMDHQEAHHQVHHAKEEAAKTPAPEENKAALERLEDIQNTLKEVERLQNHKAIIISDKEDVGGNRERVSYTMQEWYNISNCLQFLYCNSETIRRALQCQPEVVTVDALKDDIFYIEHAEIYEGAVDEIIKMIKHKYPFGLKIIDGKKDIG